MGFSFSGMMRGLGAGLVNSGTLLADKAKRDWEEQQLMLKLEREEHMERLRLQNQKELQKENLSFTGQQNNLNRAQESQQFQDTMGLKRQELAMQEKELAANTSLRQQSLALQQQEINKKGIQERMYEDQKAAVDSVAKKAFPDDPDKQEVFKFQLMYGKNKDGKEVSGEMAKVATETASMYIDTLVSESPREFQQKKEQLGFGDMSDEEASFMMKQLAARSYIDGLSGESSSGLMKQPAGQQPEPVKAIKNFGVLRIKALDGDLQAIEDIKRAAIQYPDNKKIQATLKEIEAKVKQEDSNINLDFFNPNGY